MRTTACHAGCWFFYTMVLIVPGLTGCAALTNPVAVGIPARRVPPEFLGQAREEEQQLPLNLLRQKPPDIYRLDAGDVLGVWIEGVLGDRATAPPVQFAEKTKLPPGTGFPIPVREDGMIPLPLIKPVKVKGLSLAEAEEAIRRSYTEVEKILPPGRERILVSLLRPRQTHVVVIRQDSGGVTFGSEGVLGGSKRGTGFQVDLAAYENDVLNALAQTGGLPGLDAANEIIIYRAVGKAEDAGPRVMPTRRGAPFGGPGDGAMIRIPLRLRPGEPLPFKAEDVLLQTGDIVLIEDRATEVFYTGGLLPAGEFVLPRDYDLDVVEAVARVRGPLINGGFNANNLSGSLIAPSLGAPSPSLLTVLRKTPGGGQVPIRVDLNRALRDPRERILVKPSDVLILQESLEEAFARYVTQTVTLDFFYRLFQSSRATGSTSASLP